MKKFLAVLMAAGFALFMACDDTDSGKIGGMDKVNDEALDFISKNGVELPLSVSLDQIDDLSSDEFSNFSLAGPGGTLAEATDSGASGTSSTGTVAVGISLSESLASSRAQLIGIYPFALVITKTKAFLVELIYNSDTDLYASDINLAIGDNYICVILFKGSEEWKKTGFLKLTVPEDATNIVTNNTTPVDTTPPAFILWTANSSPLALEGTSYFYSGYSVSIVVDEPSTIYILNVGTSNTVPTDTTLAAFQNAFASGTAGSVPTSTGSPYTGSFILEVQIWISTTSYFYIYAVDNAGNVSIQPLNFWYS